MLDEVKLALRIKTSAFDSEIQSLIEAAKLDLKISGVNADREDGLVKQAILLYCKSLFGLGNPDKERYWNSYQMMVQHLKLSGDYGLPGEETI